MTTRSHIWDALGLIPERDTTIAEEAARRAKHEAHLAARESVERTYLPYVMQLERLKLVCQAMWSLIEERTDLTEKDLLARVTALDLQDGVLDGKCAKPPVKCPKCGNTICRKFNRCLFCGEKAPDASAFDEV